MNGNCQGFICGGKDLQLYDSAVWQFLGKGQYGKQTFTFDESLDTFVIHYENKIGFDALSGTTPDEKTVTYGYLADGTITVSYMDSSNISFRTLSDAENRNIPVNPPCGIIDPTVNGDGSFIVSGGPGGIVFSFLDRGFYNNPFATRKGYELTSLTIVSASASDISPDKMCP